ncbi:MAG: hypothetical protein RJA22_591, partial [Verrucomicrobiota bacterium]
MAGARATRPLNPPAQPAHAGCYRSSGRSSAEATP